MSVGFALYFKPQQKQHAHTLDTWLLGPSVSFLLASMLGHACRCCSELLCSLYIYVVIACLEINVQIKKPRDDCFQFKSGDSMNIQYKYLVGLLVKVLLDLCLVFMGFVVLEGLCLYELMYRLRY